MKKHLLFVCHNAQFNGAEYSLFRLLREIQEHYKISVLAPGGGEFEKQIRAQDLDFYSYQPLFPFRLKHSQDGALAGFITQLQKNFESLSKSLPKPDLIHSNTFFVWEGAALAAHFKCPHVWNLREIVMQSPTWEASFGMDRQLQEMDTLTDAFVCVSEALAGQLPESMQHKTTAVHNGLEMKDRKSRVEARSWMEDKFGFNAQTKVILTVGNFVPEKGHAFLLPIAKRILNRYQEVKFLWIGRHDFHYKHIMSEIEKQDLSHAFICPGQVNNVGAYMAGADLYCLPSETEAFPTVLLEARHCDLPFIARDCGGAIEIAKQGGGVCTDLNDAQQFELAMVEALENPSQYLNKNKDAFTMKNMGTGYRSTYDKLLQEPLGSDTLLARQKQTESLMAMANDLQYTHLKERQLKKLLGLRGIHRLIKKWIKPISL